MRDYKNYVGGHSDLRTMLLESGAGQYNAIMSIPYMNFLPSTTDPYTQGVIQIVQGLQRMLNKRGAHLEVNGGMGVETVRALIPWAGPRWYDKSWSQLYGDVMRGEHWDGWKRFDRSPRKMSVNGYIQSLGDDTTGYHMVSGVAVPDDASTLTLFQMIQRTINALSAKFGYSLIAVDGRIGPATLAAAKIVADVVNPGSQTTADVQTVAANAQAALTELLGAQTQYAAEPVADPAPTKLPSSYVSGGKVINPTDKDIASAEGGFVATLFSPIGFAAMAIGGLLLFKGKSKPKRRR